MCSRVCDWVPCFGTIKGTQSESGGSPGASTDRTALADFSSLDDFSFLNSTNCSSKTPGGGNQDYRESVACSQASRTRRRDDSEQDVSARGVCFLPGLPASGAWFLLPHLLSHCFSAFLFGGQIPALRMVYGEEQCLQIKSSRPGPHLHQHSLRVGTV